MIDMEAISQAYEVCLDVTATEFGISISALSSFLLFFILWVLVWKGFALWKSARRRQSVWFVILLITNTLGILPIIYLLVYRKKK